MKKKLTVLILILAAISFSVLSAVDKEQAEAWMDLVGEKDMQIKLQKLEAYYNKYGAKEDRNSMYLYLHLAETTYQLQQYEKTIQFGEKALSYKEIEASHKLRVYLYLANAYNLTKKDPEKSYSYAEQVIELAKSLRSVASQSNQTFDVIYTAPALRVQVQLLVAKSQEPSILLEAFNKALEAYQIDKSEKSASIVVVLSDRLAKKEKVEEAIRGIEIINQNKPNADYYKLLGIWYERLKNRAKAIENLKASYDLKKNAKVAYDLGVLLNQTDLDSALNFLAEANLLNDEKYSPEALKLLQHLFFNIKTKGQPAADQEKEFQGILDAAKTRLGITITPPESGTE